MTITMTIDTLQVSNDMQKVGMEKPMADQLAEILRKAGNDSVSDLVRKTDLEHQLQLINSEIVNVRSEIKNSMLTTIISVGSMMTVAVGVIIAVIKL